MAGLDNFYGELHIYIVERKNSEKTTEDEKKEDRDLGIWLFLRDLHQESVVSLQVQDCFNGFLIIFYLHIEFTWSLTFSKPEISKC